MPFKKKVKEDDTKYKYIQGYINPYGKCVWKYINDNNIILPKNNPELVSKYFVTIYIEKGIGFHEKQRLLTGFYKD